MRRLDDFYAKADTVKLKPCPFCGNTQQHPTEERVRCWLGGDCVYVQCGVCSAKGFSVPLPGHINDLKPHLNSVDLNFFGLSEDVNAWGTLDVELWMVLLAAKNWNNRKEPRDPST